MMLFIFVSRTAAKIIVGQVKKFSYNRNLKELNKEAEDFKFLAIAEVEVSTTKKLGPKRVRVQDLRNKAAAALGRNKRIFAAVETKDNEVIYLLINQKELGDEEAIDIAEVKVDSTFANNRGFSVLTASNTVVTRKEGEENVYVFQPNNTGIIKKSSFKIRVVGEEENRKLASDWLDTVTETAQ